MYKLLPAKDENALFYRLDGEAAERCGQIGYLRADFGGSGREFYSTWFNNQSRLKTYSFKREFDKVIDSLRDDGYEPPFSGRRNLEAFCMKRTDCRNPGNFICSKIGTPNHSYYFRCRPAKHDYDLYCFCYDNSYLLPELAGRHELPDICYSVNPTTKELILIKKHEAGYYRCEYSTSDPGLNRRYADAGNLKLDVTRAQEEAMLAGSVYGWNIPAAKPWNYGRDGRLRLLHQPKNNDRER
jgi:hypothetical protein